MAKTGKKKDQEEVTFNPPEALIDPHQYNGLRSMFAVIENYKNIDTKIVNISGKSILVIGRNAAGKSSFIQVLKGSLDSKQLPEIGLKEGEDHGHFIHRIAGNVEGDYMEYTIEYFFTEKNKSGRLKLTDKDGNDVKSPATVLKSLIGNVSFSPVKFINDKKDVKLKTLKDITGRSKEIDVVNYDIDVAKKDITKKKDECDTLEAQLVHKYTEDDIRRYSNPIPLEPINQKIDALDETHKVFNSVLASRNEFQAKLTACDNAVSMNMAEINRLIQQISEIQNKINELGVSSEKLSADKIGHVNNIQIADKWMLENTAPDMKSVAEELQAATVHNGHYNAIVELSEKHKKLSAGRTEIMELEAKRDKLISSRTKIIEESQLPIKGLSFTDQDILLDGIPLEDGQVNTAMLWEVSIKIAKAMNPTYRGIFIDDGSLLDKDHLKAIIEEIERDGYFAIVELVDYNGGGLDVKFTEDIFKVTQ